MKTFTSLLEEALEGWSDARQGLIAEAENIPARQFEFRPTPTVRSAREVIVHILEVAMMMTGELTRVDTNFHRAPWPKLLGMYAQAAYRVKTKADVVKVLKSQFTQAERQFLKAGELHMLQLIERFDGELGLGAPAPARDVDRGEPGVGPRRAETATLLCDYRRPHPRRVQGQRTLHGGGIHDLRYAGDRGRHRRHGASRADRRFQGTGADSQRAGLPRQV